MTTKPQILISRAEHIPSENWNDYATCVTQAGGIAIPYDLDTYYTQTKLPEYDGIVLTAGIDVQPDRYDEKPHPKVTEWDVRRDDFESALIADALQNKKALLCICRGIQLLNCWVKYGLMAPVLDRRQLARCLGCLLSKPDNLQVACSILHLSQECLYTRVRVVC